MNASAQPKYLRTLQTQRLLTANGTMPPAVTAYVVPPCVSVPKGGWLDVAGRNIWKRLRSFCLCKVGGFLSLKELAFDLFHHVL